MSAEIVEIEVFLEREASTLAFGERIARVVEPGMFIALRGNLGSGKTTLTRGLLRGMGYQGKVKSPTYTLVELYKLSKLDLYHFDFYRFNDSTELSDAGFRDHFDGRSVCIVEWPERVMGRLPPADLEISLAIEGDGRRARIVTSTEHGKLCLETMSHEWQ